MRSLYMGSNPSDDSAQYTTPRKNWKETKLYNPNNMHFYEIYSISCKQKHILSATKVAQTVNSKDRNIIFNFLKFSLINAQNGTVLNNL